MDGLGTAGGAHAYASLERPPLDAASLRRAVVTAGSMWNEVRVVDDAGSTNAVLVAEARRGAASGRVLLAEHQSAGRGRLDRAWSAPPRSSLAMSALVRPAVMAVRSWPWIPLLTGLAVAAAARRVAEVPATLKWPNDVLVGEQKLAGILVEHVDSPPRAVIGVGLNVSQTRAELPGPQATSLALAGAASADRSLLARTILRGLENLLVRWERSGGEVTDEFVAAYVDACSTIGRRVRVQFPEAVALGGEAVGVDRQGRLLVRDQSNGATVSVSAGDVVHLRPT